MQITFNKIDNMYVAEFQVTADFNLHIERVKNGDFTIYQRTPNSGEYSFVISGNFDFKKVIDEDVVGAIYPKYIKVVSASEPTLAIVTYNE